MPFIAVLALLPEAASQVAQKANEEYRTATARSKAAFEMEHPNRTSIERSADLAASLGIRPGDVVADVGTGAGYFLRYLVAAVGEQGRVLAEDIHPDFLRLVRRKITENRWKNVTAVLGTEKDPRLPAASLDVVLILDTYHHLDYPNEVLTALRRALKPGGRLIIVDFYRSRKHPGAADADLKTHVRADRDQVIGEVTANKFRLERTFDHLPHEYVAVFRNAAPSAESRARGGAR
jgi:ubiquinone/menaquinone biosynthesis C-methylase UbiE